MHTWLITVPSINLKSSLFGTAFLNRYYALNINQQWAKVFGRAIVQLGKCRWLPKAKGRARWRLLLLLLPLLLSLFYKMPQLPAMHSNLSSQLCL